MKTEAELRQDADDYGFTGAEVDAFVARQLKRQGGAPKEDAPAVVVEEKKEVAPAPASKSATTTKSAPDAKSSKPTDPKAARVKALGVEPTVKVTTKTVAVAPGKPTEPDYGTSSPGAPDPFDVDSSERETGLVQQSPDTSGLGTIPAAVVGLRERPARSPQAQASDFRPRLSPVSNVMHALDPATVDRNVPPVGFTPATALPSEPTGRRQAIMDALGLPGATVYTAPKPAPPVAPAPPTGQPDDAAVQAAYAAFLQKYPDGKAAADKAMTSPEGRAKLVKYAQGQ